MEVPTGARGLGRTWPSPRGRNRAVLKWLPALSPLVARSTGAGLHSKSCARGPQAPIQPSPLSGRALRPQEVPPCARNGRRPCDLKCRASGSPPAAGDSSPPASPGGSSSLVAIFSEPIVACMPESCDSQLVNQDFMPTLASQRILGTWDIVALWVGLVVGVPTWYLAGSLVELGMSWWQGTATVLAGNILVLAPMLLNGHPGCKYGIPFPVLARASFGVYGANIASLLRGTVACGWFGIQTFIGGQAISQLGLKLLRVGVASATPGASALAAWGQTEVPALGLCALDLSTFMLFWALQLAIVWNGIESIKTLERYSAPILLSLCLALLFWAYTTAGGFGPMLSAPSQFAVGQPKHGLFWAHFFPALTANIGFWATLSLNIPDFTRFAKSQRVQAVGQIVGLPLFMAVFSFVGLAVTSSTAVIFGRVISDPVALLGQLEGVVPSLLATVGLILATLTTNIAANVVAPANALVNLAPHVFTFRRAGLLTAVLGVLMAPWRLVQSSDNFISWLIAYSALLGPVAGVVVCDYFVLRSRELDTTSLFLASPASSYWYAGGFNMRALAALAIGILPNLPGLLEALDLVAGVPKWLSAIYGNAWIVGFFLSALAYALLMKGSVPSAEPRMSPAV